MKRFVLPALIAGLVLLTLIALHVGIGGILRVLGQLGIGGFLLIVGIHLALNQGLSTAWYLLKPAANTLRFRSFAWARLMRDAASEALPLSQLGGQVLGGRALVMGGATPIFAGVSSLVDITMEAMMQVAYAAIGLVLLALSHRDQTLILPLAAGAAVMGVLVLFALCVLATAPAWAERRMVGLVQRMPILGRSTAPGEIMVELRRIFARSSRLGGAAVTHLACWTVTGFETWVMLRLVGQDATLAEGIVIDSLLSAIRSFAFFVPNALGVQEGAYIMICGIYGLPADVGIALSLIRRARDLAIGLPTLLIWQGTEGWRLMVRKRVGKRA